MGDRTRLAITGVVAVAAVGLTIGGHALSGGHGFSFTIDDDEPRAMTRESLARLKDFDGVQLNGPDRVIIEQGKSFAVRADGDADAVKQLEIDVKGDVLHIGRRKHVGFSKGEAVVHVTMPALERLWLAGSGEIEAAAMEGRDAKALVTGSGNLKIARISARNAAVTVTGSGSAELAGKAQEAELVVTGSGHIEGEELTTETAKVRVMGSGGASVRASQSADLTLTGSGEAHVLGTNQCRIIKSGSGEADCST